MRSAGSRFIGTIENCIERAALQEQHPVAVVDTRQVAARLLRFLDDLVEHLAAMAVLADAEPAAGHVPDVLLRLLEHRLGKDRGAGAEVPDAVGHFSISVRSSEMMCELPLRIAWSCSGAGRPSRWIRASVAVAP